MRKSHLMIVWLFLLQRQSVNVRASCTGDIKFDAPVFDDGANLSWENCGLWTTDGDITRPPWRAFITLETIHCFGHLLSPTTIIAIDCTIFHDVLPEDAYKIVKSVRLFLGTCADDAYLANYPWSDHTNHTISGNCRADGKGQISQALEFNYIKLDYTNVAVLKMDKVDFKLNYIWPVCLFNKNNHEDFNTANGKFFTSNREWLRSLTYPASLVPISTSYCNFHSPSTYNKNLTDRDEECHRYNILVCARYESDFDDEFITLWYNWYKYSRRFFLRGLTIYHGNYDDEVTKISHRVFVDLLSIMHQIASYTRDIYIMPKIPLSKPKPDFSGSDLNSNECGLVASRRRREATPFITRGSAAQKYEHPWHAALVTDVEGIVCGGTLISKKAVLTAAHCLYNRDKILRRPLEIEAIIGLLTEDDLYDTSSAKAQAKKPYEFKVHRGYNPYNHDDDIALMFFNSEFTITDTVRPICLWSNNFDFGLVEHMRGDVVGWGLTEQFEQSNHLRKANLRIESYRECYLKLRSFFSRYLKPGLNFCAGSNGVGACNGDSGGGFSVKSKGRVWLRGLVSFGNTNKVVNNGGTVRTCNLNIPSLYVDLASYMDWIISNHNDYE